jgi:hypothetical protein
MKLTKAVLLASSVFFLAACGDDNSEPAECTQYFETINTCVANLTKDKPEIAEQFKSTFDEQKKAMFENEAFKKLDKKQQGQACKAADEAFKQQSKAMGC